MDENRTRTIKIGIEADVEGFKRSLDEIKQVYAKFLANHPEIAAILANDVDKRAVEYGSCPVYRRVKIGDMGNGNKYQIYEYSPTPFEDNDSKRAVKYSSGPLEPSLDLLWRINNDSYGSLT